MSSTFVHAPSFHDTKRHASSAFLAGDETIEIVPNFSYDKPLGLMTKQNVGPFSAGISAKVPLWLALLLKQKYFCEIVTPDWMEVEKLKEILKEERKEDAFNKDLPFRYLEISRSLLHAHTMQDHESIRILLQDIQTVRMDKIRTNLYTLSSSALQSPDDLPIIDVSGIGSLELAAIEPFCRTAFRHHLMLSKREQQAKHIADEDKDGDGNGTGGPPKAAVNRLRRFRN